MDNAHNSELNRYLSPINVWALSFGCAVGWGAFVMPGTTFLPIAGPVGTVVGMTLGGVVMLIIGYNYHCMMNHCPDAGGTYAYSKRIFGYDHGFLSAWFLILVYIAITWANATALPLIFRRLLGDLFQFGFRYQIAGYDVYLGEITLSLGALFFFGVICIRGGKFAARIQTCAALILLGGIFICFGSVLYEHGLTIFNVEPAFVPDIDNISAIFGIVVLSPWAFVGFESISQSSEGFTFPITLTFAIIFFAILAGVLSYIFLSVTAISALPLGYTNWLDYISDLDKLRGVESLPTFFAVNSLMGNSGLIIITITVIAGIVTGLVGNYIAASRLIYALTRDDLLPSRFGILNRYGTPKNAIILIMLLSIPIPFLGRTAISWIIDVNTIGATIGYAYTSAAAFVIAKQTGNILAKISGAFGVIVSTIFCLYFMIPNLWIVDAMSTESYLILIMWSLLGFVFFRYIFKRDVRRHLGKTTVVWMALLTLIFFTLAMWLRQSTHATTRAVLDNLNEYYVEELHDHDVSPNAIEKADSEAYLRSQIDFVNDSLMRDNALQMAVIVMSLFVMFNIYNMMMRREKEMEIRKIEAEQSSLAKSTFLSNMSHDIRTPMNAIIGYTTLLKKEPGLTSGAKDYLDKIEASNKHLLALINDILDMSRIESGKMELTPVKADLLKVLDEVRDLFSTQMITKSIEYTVTAQNVKNRVVWCDTNFLNRVLLNLISNAYKFTPEGGKVSVTLRQVGLKGDVGEYELRVKDTGMGMSQEFAVTVFDAYSRDKAVNQIQGTGLGMAITKSIVEFMRGRIDVYSEEGNGTEFIVNVDFKLVGDVPDDEVVSDDSAQDELNFDGMKLLLVDDNEVNREIASMILTEFGFEVDMAENGKQAVEKVAASDVGEYKVVLMDVQMPVMNGYEATRAIRNLDNVELAQIPIIAMTANAFTEDIQATKDAGMNAHIAKPIDMEKMIETISKFVVS